MRQKLIYSIGQIMPILLLILLSFSSNAQKFELMNDVSCTTVEQDVAIFPFDNDLINISNIDFSTFDIVIPASQGTASWDPNTYVLNYSPNANMVGSDQLVYELCTFAGVCETATIDIMVQAVSIIPLVDVFTFDAPSFTGNVIANDVISPLSSNNYDVILINAPTNGTVALQTNGDFTYTQNPNYVGKDYFTYEVCDLTNNICAETTVALHVMPVPTDPNNYVLINDFGLTFTSNTNFVNYLLSRHNTIVNTAGLPVSFNLISNATNGTLIFNSNGTFSYITSTNFTGKDEFTYEVCVGTDCTPATVFIDVLDENEGCRRHFPNALNNTHAVCNIEELGGNFKFNDLFYGYFDDTQITILDGPDNGTFTYDQAGNFNYLPNPDYSGIDRIEYEICEEDLSIMDYNFSAMNPNMNVPFGATSTLLEETIYVTDPGVLADIEITVQIKHDAMEELEVNLIHPNGTVIPLMLNACTGFGDFDLVFSDSAVNTIDCNISSAQLISPLSPLFPVLSTAIQGDWTLQILDNVANQNQGVLTGWGIESTLNSVIVRDCRKAWIEIPVIDKVQVSLDLDLLDFKLSKGLKNSVNINWTSNEYGEAEFYNIERSSNENPEWITVAKINAKNVLQARYSFVDRELEASKYYYRLQKHENNAEVFTSEIRSITIASENSRGLISNLTDRNLEYQFDTNENVTIEIYDSAGKRVLQTVGSANISLDISSLSTGMYVSVVKNATGFQSEKFFKK